VGEVIEMPPASNQNRKMSFPKKTFMPYKSYRITLSVVKGDRASSFESIILFQELDLP